MASQCDVARAQGSLFMGQAETERASWSRAIALYAFMVLAIPLIFIVPVWLDRLYKRNAVDWDWVESTVNQSVSIRLALQEYRLHNAIYPQTIDALTGTHKPPPVLEDPPHSLSGQWHYAASSDGSVYVLYATNIYPSYVIFGFNALVFRSDYYYPYQWKTSHTTHMHDGWMYIIGAEDLLLEP